MKFIKTVSLRCDPRLAKDPRARRYWGDNPSLSKQPKADLYRDDNGKYYAKFNVGLEPIIIEIKDDTKAEFVALDLLYIQRRVDRCGGRCPPDFPPELAWQLAEGMPAFLRRLDGYSPFNAQSTRAARQSDPGR